MKRRGFGPAKFRNVAVDFRQAIERDPVVEMMYMVKANIGAKPSHDGACLEMAGRFEGGLFKRPSGFVIENDAGEIVLGIKKVTAQGATKQAGKNQSQQHRPPAGKKHQYYRQRKMQDKGQEAVEMLAGGIDERINDHAEKKNKNITEHDNEWMAHEQVFEAFAGAGIMKLFFGHDGIGANVSTAQFGVVSMVMVMRTAPDAARTQSPNAIETHEKFRQTRFGQNGAVLLVMVNHKEPDHQQSSQSTANKAQREWQHRESSGNRNGEQKCRGKDAPPTFPGMIMGVLFGARM